ncbi:hypothetical protein GCM10027570_44580 [Streptomonospora sediminis]
MRFCIEVAAADHEIPWEQVHAPARAVLYELVGEHDAALAAELHDQGWSGSTLRPLGICPPVFAKAKPGSTGIAVCENGRIRLGSPVPRIAGCLLGSIAQRQELRWGGLTVKVGGVQVDPAPDHSAGTAVFETLSPVVLKHESRFLLPEDSWFVDRFVHNVRHKADVLGLPNEAAVEVLDSGPRRRFHTGKGYRIGARATVRISAAPSLLDALYDWGLGLQTVQGFGWVK